MIPPLVYAIIDMVFYGFFIAFMIKVLMTGPKLSVFDTGKICGGLGGGWRVMAWLLLLAGIVGFILALINFFSSL